MFKDEHILGVQTCDTTYIVAYFSPKTPVAEIITDIHQAIKIATNSVVNYGDFNCRIDSQEPSAWDLVEALRLFNLHLVNDPQNKTYIAHNGQSTIDLIFVTEDLTNCTDLQILPTVDRKHQRLSISVQLAEPETKHSGKRSGRPIRKIRDGDLENNLQTMCQQPGHSPNKSYKQFLELIERSASITTPKARKNKPWFDHECKQLKK